MAEWNQHNVHKHMHVFSSDQKDLGHIEEVYEDSFKMGKGLIFSTHRYIPYNAIASVNNSGVQLLMRAEEANNKEWEVRPDYEEHPGDPTQLFYDRGHGVHDPFDEVNPDNR